MSKQHKNATTTPEMRAFIRESDLSTAMLARLLKISESTVRKWRKRDITSDASHKPKQLNTTLSQAQEYVVVYLRTHLKLSLDDLLTICKTYINEHTSRAGLQRCLKRHGVSRLSDMNEQELAECEDLAVCVDIEESNSHSVISSEISPQAMSSVLNQMRQQQSSLSEHVLDQENTILSETDVVQVNVTCLPRFAQDQQTYRLLVANDPDSDWIYVDLYDDGEKQAARRYMQHVLKKAPFHIRRILAANYKEFLSRFRLLDK